MSFEGQVTNETAPPNPFTNFRFNITFIHQKPGTTLVVLGYYAADADASSYGTSSGNVWRAHLVPSEFGTWTYTASFRTGNNVATSLSRSVGTPARF